MLKISKYPPLFGVLLGCILYELGTTSLYLYQPHIIPSVLRFGGLLVIIYFTLKSPKIRLNGNISVVFRFLIVWSLFIVLRGPLTGSFRPDTKSIYDVIFTALLGQFGDLTYFVPLFALFSVRLDSLYYIKKVSIVCCILFIVLIVLNREQILAGMLMMGRTNLVDYTGEPITVRDLMDAVFPGFGLVVLILLCFGYIRGKLSILYPISLLVYSLCYAIGGGRGGTVFSFVYFLTFLFIYYKYPVIHNKCSSNKKVKRFFSKIMILLIVVFLIGGVIYLYNETQVFDFLLEHAFGGREIGQGEWNDNRDVITNDFIKDFNAHPFSWIWGRGVNGAFLTNYYKLGEHRIYMEWGFLYLILKGGVVYLCLYLYCMLHGAYMGLFRSRNTLSKALSFMCLFIVMNMISTGSNPQFSTLFILGWISFGLVERKEVRLLDDVDIYNYFNIKKYGRLKKEENNNL